MEIANSVLSFCRREGSVFSKPVIMETTYLCSELLNQILLLAVTRCDHKVAPEAFVMKINQFWSLVWLFLAYALLINVLKFIVEIEV